jgi:hypothetical protein
VLIKRWTHSARIFLVQMANQQVGKPDGVNSGSELAQSHRVTDERFADETFASGPTDLAIAADSAKLIVLWVADLGQTRRKRSFAFAIPFGRHGLSQSFVGTQMVVTPQPGGRAVLLPSPGMGWRLGGFLLHHSVKLFVCAVVLGTSRASKFHPNA